MVMIIMWIDIIIIIIIIVITTLRIKMMMTYWVDIYFIAYIYLRKKIFRSGISRASCIDITIWYRFQYKVWRIAHSQQQGISCSLPKPNKMAPNHIVRVIDYSSATSLPLLIRYDRRTIHHYIFRFGLYQGMRDSGDIFLDLLLKCINVLFGKLR